MTTTDTTDDSGAFTGMHPIVLDQFEDLVRKRFPPSLRARINGIADREIAKALAEVGGGEPNQVIGELVTEIVREHVQRFLEPDGGPTDRLFYRNLETFCTDFFFELYARDVAGSNSIKWCPQWWLHPDAIVRLKVIWLAWERHRRDPEDGVSTWLLYHADPHMARLTDPDGPFKYCDGSEGHFYKQTQLTPLPHSPAPEGMFTDEDSGERLFDQPRHQDSAGIGDGRAEAALADRS